MEVFNKEKRNHGYLAIIYFVASRQEESNKA